MSKVRNKKIQFSVTLDEQLVEEFKIDCIRAKAKPPVVIDKLVREHLRKNSADAKKLATSEVRSNG